MKRHPPLRLNWPLLRSVISVVCLAGWVVSSAAQPSRGRTFQLLDARKAQQSAAGARLKAFHDFQFVDRREASGITFLNQVVDDAAKYWKPAHYDHGNGIAVADVDGDGKLDIYFTSQLGSNELWRNLGRGKFENITAKADVGLKDQICVTASFADIDNDGDPDLFVTTVRHGNHLFLNTGGGTFRDVSKEAGVDYAGHSSGAVFFDYDNDGLLDLFVANPGVYTTNEKGRGGYYRAMTNAFWGHTYPERTEYSLLYKNLGNAKFREVSEQMNLRDGSWSGDAAICDLNGDGFPDLYIVNMQGDDHYYENSSGKRFVERTAEFFPKTPWGAMGVKFFDFNNDGLMDLYVTDMHSDMSPGKIAQAKDLRLEPEKSKSEAFCVADWTDAFLQGASNNVFGNAFYVNKGGGKFEEMSDALGAETYWPWGMSVGDLNADGFEDIFVSAGMGYPFDYAINSLLINDRGVRFADAEFLLGLEPRARRHIDKDYFTLDCAGEDKNNPPCEGERGLVPIKGAISTRSSVLFDLDDDGDLDIVTAECNDRPQVLISNLTNKRAVQFLKVKLVGRKSNRDGLGALVTLSSGGMTLARFQDGKSGYLSQSSMPLYFGLGTAKKVDRLAVAWPSGKKQIVPAESISPNKLLTIREPD